MTRRGGGEAFGVGWGGAGDRQHAGDGGVHHQRLSALGAGRALGGPAVLGGGRRRWRCRAPRCTPSWGRCCRGWGANTSTCRGPFIPSSGSSRDGSPCWSGFAAPIAAGAAAFGRYLQAAWPGAPAGAAAVAPDRAGHRCCTRGRWSGPAGCRRWSPGSTCSPWRASSGSARWRCWDRRRRRARRSRRRPPARRPAWAGSPSGWCSSRTATSAGTRPPT